MDHTNLGKTGLKVSRLGFGLYELGTLEGKAGGDDAGRLLNVALDSGINFLDTAACYGNSEDFIGNAVGHRRSEYVLATKCGHVTDDSGGQEWTSQTIRGNINRSLRRLKTDHLDIVQLHSCNVDVLERGEAIEELSKAKESGKTRFIGYSGDNEAARRAIEIGVFDTLQTSFSLLDQFARIHLLEAAEAKGLGIIIKRPIANAIWQAKPHDCPNLYIDRAKKMAEMGPIPGDPDNPILLALGFVLAHQEVDTAIVGTVNTSHLQSNIEMVENRLPIASDAVRELERRFDLVGVQWQGVM